MASASNVSKYTVKDAGQVFLNDVGFLASYSYTVNAPYTSGTVNIGKGHQIGKVVFSNTHVDFISQTDGIIYLNVIGTDSTNSVDAIIGSLILSHASAATTNTVSTPVEGKTFELLVDNVQFGYVFDQLKLQVAFSGTGSQVFQTTAFWSPVK